GWCGGGGTGGARKWGRRGGGGGEGAPQARWRSSGVVRHSAAMMGRRQVFATSRTAAKSSSEAIGNPASIMSTPSASSCRAILSFSSRFMLHPGDCSPSRNVVSKIATCSLIHFSPSSNGSRKFWSGKPKGQHEVWTSVQRFAHHSLAREACTVYNIYVLISNINDLRSRSPHRGRRGRNIENQSRRQD